MEILIQILIYGTINSIALALMALGFALVYGISRIPNFAHGAIYVVAGFITWTFIKIVRGKGRQVNWIMYAATAAFILYFILPWLNVAFKI